MTDGTRTEKALKLDLAVRLPIFEGFHEGFRPSQTRGNMRGFEGPMELRSLYQLDLQGWFTQLLSAQPLSLYVLLGGW